MLDGLICTLQKEQLMEKTSTLNHRLKNYSLMAGSILASNVAANAQVFYKDLKPDVELGGVVDANFPDIYTHDLDLNNDGNFDFKISLTNYGVDTQAPGYNFKEGIDGDFNIGNNVIFSYTIEYAPWPIKFNCNNEVPFSYYQYGAHFVNIGYQFGAQIGAGNWKNVVDKYLGVKFKAGDGLHYGWVRLDVNTAANNIPNIIIKSWAYEGVPNKKITVCDTIGFGVGINELESAENQLIFFPNPSNGKCNINLSKGITGDVELLIVDALGRKMLNTTIYVSGDQTELPFDFSELLPGLYFIHLKTEHDSFDGKWVKN